MLLVNEAGCRLFPIHELSAVGRPRVGAGPQPAACAMGGAGPVAKRARGGRTGTQGPRRAILSVRVAGLPGPDRRREPIVVASDISQLRRLEQVRQEFVANASHELKTPLASIKACVETLLDGALEDVEIRVRFLQMVNEQTERLDKLVRDLLALTRIESQERPPAVASGRSGRHRRLVRQPASAVCRAQGNATRSPFRRRKPCKSWPTKKRWSRSSTT